MPLDPSFRSRLREALQQSRGGMGNPARDGSHDVEKQAGPNNYAPQERGFHVEQEVDTEDERRRRVDELQASWIADALGGWWNRDCGGTCLVVDRVYPADRVHGDAEIGNYAETLSRYRASLRAFDAIAPPTPIQPLFSEMDDGSCEGADCGPNSAASTQPPTDAAQSATGESAEDERLLFFDLETTGLTGGAGTCAFLIGYGWFECGSFRTRQYFLGGFGHEPAMLRMAGELLSGTTLTSFNGKTFDVPLIVGRYLFHRLPCPFDAIRHVDLLHPARRLWRHRPADYAPAHDGRRAAFARYFRMTRSAGMRFAATGSSRVPGVLSETAASCALGALEEAVLGYRRTGDVPGGEIPGRYFQYVRTGDVRPLSSVLEHNRLDLVSLAALASIVARMLQEGPDAARNAHECLALGRLYEHSGAADRATACYEKAVEGDAAAAWRRDELVEREALRRLAMRHRRERRYQEAAAAWQRLVDLPGPPGSVDFEALHALAVHYEHRARDLQAARALVIRAIEGSPNHRAAESLRYRLTRIDRKLSGKTQ